MVGVLNPVGLDHFNLVSNFYREMHAKHAVALLDLFKNAFVKLGILSSFVKTFTNGIKKTVLRIHGIFFIG